MCTVARDPPSWALAQREISGMIIEKDFSYIYQYDSSFVIVSSFLYVCVCGVHVRFCLCVHVEVQG